MTETTVIPASLVKELRDKSGAGVIACKNALVETQGDFEAAIERLRAAEFAKAETESSRVAAEGLVSLVVDGRRGALVELNTETDFVARTEAFRSAATALAAIALAVEGDHAALLGAPAPDGDGRVSDLITRLSARTGEHVTLRRSAHVSARRGVVVPYVHSAVAPGVGRIAVLVALESAADDRLLIDIGHKVAMHVAASAPLWVSQEDIPADAIAEKRAGLIEQAKATGKPAAIVEKMVEGRMRKFYEEVVLGLQPFVLNPDQRVEAAIHEAAAAAGTAIAVKAFVRFKTGEGLSQAD